jgi:glycosyltransferase AglD
VNDETARAGAGVDPSVLPQTGLQIGSQTGGLHGTIVMASYNEAESITQVLDELAEAAAHLARLGVSIDVLLVDDNSPDGTAQLATRLAGEAGIAFEVLEGHKAGLGAALIRGFRHVEARSSPHDFIVTLDADGQHDARQLPGLVEAFLARNSGVMIGSRWTKGGSSPGTTRLRSVMSQAGNFAFRVVTGTRGVRDATTSYRVIRPEVASLFDPAKLRVDGYAFFSAFIALAQANGYTVHESPIVFRPRVAGLSKLTLRDCSEFFVNLFSVRKVAAAARAQHRSSGGRAVRSPFPGTSVSVIFPAYMEEQYLPRAVTDVVTGLRDRAADFEVIIVENGSRDRTREVADELAAEFPEVIAMSHHEPDYGRSLRAGLLRATKTYVCNFDVDLYDLEFLERAISKSQDENLAVVVGSKRGEGSNDTRPFIRKLVTFTFSTILKIGFGLKVSDTHGMKVLRRADVVPLAEKCQFGTDLFDTELVLRTERTGHRTGEIGVTVEEMRDARTPIVSRITRSLTGLARLRVALWRQGSHRRLR